MFWILLSVLNTRNYFSGIVSITSFMISYKKFKRNFRQVKKKLLLLWDWRFGSGNSIVPSIVSCIAQNIYRHFMPGNDVAALTAFCLSSSWCMPSVLVSDYRTLSFLVSYKRECNTLGKGNTLYTLKSSLQEKSVWVFVL